MNPFDLLDLVLLGLATWRVSSLVLYESGPFSVFAHLRHIVKADRPGELTGLAELFSCLWCLSVWIGAGLFPLLLLGDLGRWILAIPAASAIAILLNVHVRK